jgi:hypothetical protein
MHYDAVHPKHNGFFACADAGALQRSGDAMLCVCALHWKSEIDECNAIHVQLPDWFRLFFSLIQT